MLEDWIRAATALSRAAVVGGADDRGLHNIQINLPRDIYDRMEREVGKGTIPDVKIGLAETVRINGIKFVRSPL